MRHPAEPGGRAGHAGQPRFRRTGGAAGAGRAGPEAFDYRRNAPGRGQRRSGGPAPTGHCPGSLSQRPYLRQNGDGALHSTELGGNHVHSCDWRRGQRKERIRRGPHPVPLRTEGLSGDHAALRRGMFDPHRKAPPSAGGQGL